MKKINLIFIAIISLLIISCKEKKPEVKSDSKTFCLSDTAMKMIEIDSVKMCDIEDEIKLSGEVSFDDNKVFKVFPRSSGQVIECKVSLGDKVSEGQVLAVVRSADVAGSYADINAANADVAITKREFENQESLFKSGIASERELTAAKQNYEKAKAVKHKIEITLNINGGNKTNSSGTYYLTAPSNGYIVEKKINAGNFIRNDMNDYLFSISNLKDVWVIANVYEADISKVKKGFKVVVTTLAYPDKKFKSSIENVSEVLDPTNKVLKVRIRLDNSEMLLKPEMFTTVIVTNVINKRSLCVPKNSIIEEGGKSYIIVYNSKCNLVVKEVNIQQQLNDKVYLNSGVLADERIITKGALLVYDELTDNL